MGRIMAWIIAGLCCVPIVDASAPEKATAPAVLTTDFRIPFRSDNIDVWLPVLLATRDVDAAVDAVQGRTVNYYDLQPLGDVDRDGAADFLLASRIHILENRTADFSANPDVSTLVATSGANGEPLWSRGLAADQAWFGLGDIDVDGVNDFAVSSYNSTFSGTALSTPVAGQSTSHRPYRTEYGIVNGRTGNVMFTRAATGYFNLEVTYASAPLTVINRLNLTSTGEGPMALAPGLAGLDWSRYQSNVSVVLAFAGVAFTQLYESVFTPTIERLDATGATRWEFTPSSADGAVTVSSRQDVTGDGIPDYVVVTRPAQTVYSLAGAVPVSTNPRLGRVTTYDGKTGSMAWAYDVPATDHDPTKTTVLAASGGRSGNVGTVLLTLVGPVLAKPDEFATTLRLLDGATGQIQSSATFPGRYVLAAAAGDTDSDGSDELVVASIPRSAPVGLVVVTPTPPGGAELSLLTHDFTAVWTLKDIPFRSPLLSLQPDLDGDSAPDLFTTKLDGNNITTTALSSKDGRTLWNHTADRRVENLGAVPSIDGRFGSELGITELEVPQNLLPDDAGSPFGSDFNYADFGARLSLRRGNDNALLWSAAVREPSKSGETLVSPFPRLQIAGDINQDGVPDLLYTLRSLTSIRVTCSDTCIVRIIGDDELLVNLALVLSGADGSLLYSYPGHQGDLRVQRGPIHIAASPKVRANQAEGSVDGAPLAFAVVALVAASVVLTRKR